MNYKNARGLIPDCKTKEAFDVFERECRKLDSKVLAHEQDLLLLAMKKKLPEDALKFISSLDIISADQLFSELRKCWAPKTNVSQLQAQMAGIFQQSDEPVEQYGLRTMDILNKWVSALAELNDPQYRSAMTQNADKVSVECFIRGLRSELETRFTSKKQNSLQTAIAEAVEIERDYKIKMSILSHKAGVNPKSLKRVAVESSVQEEYTQPAKVFKIESQRQQSHGESPQNSTQSQANGGKKNNGPHKNGQRRESENPQGQSPLVGERVVYVAMNDQRGG